MKLVDSLDLPYLYLNHSLCSYLAANNFRQSVLSSVCGYQSSLEKDVLIHRDKPIRFHVDTFLVVECHESFYHRSK